MFVDGVYACVFMGIVVLLCILLFVLFVLALHIGCGFMMKSGCGNVVGFSRRRYSLSMRPACRVVLKLPLLMPSPFRDGRLYSGFFR
jgi:hypothetical protein